MTLFSTGYIIVLRSRIPGDRRELQLRREPASDQWRHRPRHHLEEELTYHASTQELDLNSKYCIEYVYIYIPYVMFK